MKTVNLEVALLVWTLAVNRNSLAWALVVNRNSLVLVESRVLWEQAEWDGGEAGEADPQDCD